ncbi:MAG: SIMPL domain-containing protein [Ardenticatenales bacterium]|nr:SIMPL domain-containing protein [Ardenticatenales bacterium]
MALTSSISNPYGISVFGSAVIRVTPDVVALDFSVSRLEQKPKDAFKKTHEATQQIRSYLSRAQVGDVGSSHITLSKTTRHINGEYRFLGYTARVAFQILLRKLDQMEEILAGVIDAGANEVDAVRFDTTHLKEIRAEARRQAVTAAREKAENYCKAAGVSLGEILHIEDVNPESLRGHMSHVQIEAQLDDDDTPRAFDPGSIVVTAAVNLAFSLVQPVSNP